MVKAVTEPKEKAKIAAKILLDLPAWFGIPEATKTYIDDSQTMPFFAYDLNQEAVGFISLKETSKYTVEIYCMGVLKAYHRKGFGKALIAAAEHYAVNQGYHLIQVKTVESGHYDIYDHTAQFYRTSGFKDFEVFKTLWDKHNPCQVLIKCLKHHQ